jgi:hypothetical protein
MSNIPEENEENISVSSEANTPRFGVPSSPVRLPSFASSGFSLATDKKQQPEAQGEEKPTIFSSIVQQRP